MVVHLCRTAKQGALDALAAALPGPARPGHAASYASRASLFVVFTT